MLQCFFTTSTTELRETAASSGITELGTLLREVIATEKTCDTDEGEAPPSPSASAKSLLGTFIAPLRGHANLK